jgi:hypothetical protein
VFVELTLRLLKCNRAGHSEYILAASILVFMEHASKGLSLDVALTDDPANLQPSLACDTCVHAKRLAGRARGVQVHAFSSAGISSCTPTPWLW